MPTVSSAQSRYICWLGNDLPLPSSIFDAAGHTVFNLGETSGALTSWKSGRALNSLPNALLKKAGTYQLKTGSAALVLPDYVAGIGGTVDFSFVAGGSPGPNPDPTPTTTNYNDFNVRLEIVEDPENPGSEIGQVSDVASGSTFTGSIGDRLAYNLINTTDGADPRDISFVDGATEVGLFTFPSRYLNAQFYYYQASTNRAYNAVSNAFTGSEIDISTLTFTQL